jgi:hypothetical protein
VTDEAAEAMELGEMLDLGGETEDVEPSETVDEDKELDLDLTADAVVEEDGAPELTDEVTDETAEAMEAGEELDLGDEGEAAAFAEKPSEYQGLAFDMGAGQEEAAPESIAEEEMTAEEPTTPEDIDEAEETLAETIETTAVEEGPEAALPDDDIPEKDAELAGAMGIKLDPSRDLSIDPTESGIEADLTAPDEAAAEEAPSPVLPKEELETAIERVIESKLSEKIDGLLNSAIEKAVTTEISRLKRLLTNTLSDE